MKTSSIQIPPGEYVCEILEIETAMDHKVRRVVTWRMRIIGGQHDGLIVEKRFYLVSQAVVDFLRKELAILGLTVSTSKDLETVKSQAYGTMVRLTAVMNEQGYTIYYVKERVEGIPPKVPDAAASPDW